MCSSHPSAVVPHSDSATDPAHYLTTHKADYVPFTQSPSQPAVRSDTKPVWLQYIKLQFYFQMMVQIVQLKLIQ